MKLARRFRIATQAFDDDALVTRYCVAFVKVHAAAEQNAIELASRRRQRRQQGFVMSTP